METSSSYKQATMMMRTGEMNTTDDGNRKNEIQNNNKQELFLSLILFTPTSNKVMVHAITIKRTNS